MKLRLFKRRSKSKVIPDGYRSLNSGEKLQIGDKYIVAGFSNQVTGYDVRTHWIDFNWTTNDFSNYIFIRKIDNELPF